jgi:hypothetical protein
MGAYQNNIAVTAITGASNFKIGAVNALYGIGLLMNGVALLLLFFRNISLRSMQRFRMKNIMLTNFSGKFIGMCAQALC